MLCGPLLAPLTAMLADAVERCRGCALQLLLDAAGAVPDPQPLLAPLLPALVARTAAHPPAEPAEELRLQAVQLVGRFVERVPGRWGRGVVGACGPRRAGYIWCRTAAAAAAAAVGAAAAACRPPVDHPSVRDPRPTPLDSFPTHTTPILPVPTLSLPPTKKTARSRRTRASSPPSWRRG